MHKLTKRSKGREYAFQMIYHQSMMDGSYSEVLKLFWKGVEEEDGSVKDFAGLLFKRALENKEANEQLYAKYLRDGWSVDRLGEVERSILIVAIDELFNGTAPVYAIMDDYVTLTRKFTDEKTSSFINGILESIRNSFKIERDNEPNPNK